MFRQKRRLLSVITWLTVLIVWSNMMFYKTNLTHNKEEQWKVPVINNIVPAKEKSTVSIPQTFLIEEKHFCNKLPGLKVIVYVHSAISRVTQRNITRHTWAAGYKVGIPIAVVFMVGRSKTEEEKLIVRSESIQYGDIVQGDYDDGYKLLSYKALNALYWVSRNCGHVPWTMHTDDDIMVNIYRLMNRISIIESNNTYTNTFHCNLFLKPRVLRKGKWRVSFQKYRKKYFPKFCQGPIWLIQTHNIPKLLSAVNNTEFWWIDDLYITGFLAISAGIDRTLIPYLALHKKPKEDMLNKIAWLSLEEDRHQWWKNISDKWGDKYVGKLE